METNLFELSAQEKEMLLRSEDAILNNRLVSDEELNADEEEWLNQMADKCLTLANSLDTL